jgi:hypothetical protein
MIKKIITTTTQVAAVLSALLVTSSSALAQISNPAVGTWGDPLASSCEAAPLFVSYFVLLWKAVINVGAIVVLVMFVMGAVEWLTSEGDSGKLGKARNRILHAAIGLLILVASFAIISFINMIFFGDQFDILNFSLPTGLDCSATTPPPTP